MSFSNILKTAQANATAVSASVMTLEEDSAVYSMAAYSDEEEWTLSSKYQTTEKNNYGKRYSDENFSTIDEKKNVSIDSSQINLTQESNSQYIPFIMPRYFDGIDLMDMTLSIYYVNADNAEGTDDPINVCYNSTQIKFGWVLDKEATALKGKLTFEIHARGTDPLGGEYLLKTQPNSQLEILESLHGNGQIIYNESWITSFYNKIDESVAKAETAAETAEQHLATIQEIVDGASSDLTGYSKTEADELLALKADVNTVEILQENVLNNTLAISDINDTENGILVQSKSYTDETVGTIPEETEATNVIEYVQAVLLNYYTKEEVDGLDISSKLEGITSRVTTLEEDFANFDGLAALSVSYDETTNTLSFFNGEEKIKDVVLDTSSDIEAALVPINEDLASIHENIDNLPTTLESDYYNKTQTNELLDEKATTEQVNTLSTKVATLETDVSTNKTNVSTLSTKVSELEETVNGLNQSQQYTYDATYDEEYTYTLWEIENEGLDTEIKTAKSSFKIQGGSGGSGTTSTLKIEYVTKTPLVATVNDQVLITYKFSGTDSSGDEVMEGAATWKVAGTVVATNTAISGENTFDVTNYLSIGTQKVQLSIVDDAGTLVTKSWTVQKIDVRIESTFNDNLTYPIGTVSFDYTPYGAISKDVHFILDDVEIGIITISASGIPMAYTLPEQEHGTHLLEVYMTAEVNGSTIESNHIVKDIMWFDETSDVPVISCTQQEFTALQYDSTNIVYTVYDPTTETPEVVLAVDGEIVSTLTLDSNTQTWQYKSTEVGEHTLTIICGDTVKTLKATIEKLDIELEPVTANLVFDFNPSGKSNNDADRLWSDGDVAMTVSDNFDWVNGGYQIDENGDQYFCIKAGTSADISYKLFEDDAKRNGKEFKLVFKTTNVESADAQFLTCLDSSIGIEMNVHEAYVRASAGSLYLPYSEEDIIEFEFNINKSTDDIPMVMGYEDGVATRPMIYSDSHNFTQNTPQTIAIGSDKCDVHIYRFKVYSAALTDRGILNNFIADARSAEEMISRYNRNQIYDENSQLSAETLAEKCPQLRIIKIEAPYFTNNKSDKVTGTTIQYIYKNGDPILDNWTAYNVMHSGQGTTSNEYGAAGRNLDLIMNKSGVDGLTPYIKLSDGSEVNKVSLTRDSVEVNYFNVKVNIASSENCNNALLQRRYNQYNPYIRPAKQNDSKVKDTMEFYNCVVFIKESDTDITTHREFDDCDWHFYGIGNIGDSKKTDNTRLNDPDDPLECIVEIMDNTFPNSTFPTGYTDDEGKNVYPIDPSLWIAGNTAYDSLYADLFAETSAEKKENGLADTYGWRYSYDDENSEVTSACADKWREFYTFVVTSTDEEFKANLKDYFVVDSALYFYLFTTRYTMTDNRAKNTFWHYGKCDDGVYRWDLCFDYDNDTSLGINNSGELTMTYGYEDIDYKTKGDASTGWAYNAATSTFFCRIRDLFVDELRDLFVTCESAGAWSAEGLISQFDTFQSEFPEELWRLDIERKYLRSYREGSPRFLNSMMNGKKKYQRRQFERNQEKYMASKFFGNVAVSDQIMFRCNTPTGSDVVVKPDYTLHLTPYSDMYLSVLFGATDRKQIRAEAGKHYDIECPFTTMDDTAVLVYCASFIQSMGDISACYIHDNDFSNASKLKELIIGNATEGYQNSFLTDLNLGNNTLLEKLDIQNTPNLDDALNLSKLSHLKELYAHGSALSGVTFADGGMIEIAELPAISALAMRNLLYLSDLDIISLNKLTTLTVESCDTVDVKSIIEQSANLNRVRITDIDWTLDDTSLLEAIYEMSGIDKSGYNITQSVLTGKVHVPVIRQQQLYDYQAAWSDLEITYDTLIEQFAVTFVNADENNTVLEVQYVDKGENAIDPITRETNPLSPTLPSTISHDFTFARWDKSLNEVFADRIITAVYTESLRKYQIKYVSKGTVMPGYPKEGYYGDNIVYSGNTPTYTVGESGYQYNLFNRWDKSGFLTGDFDENGVKTVNAIYDTFTYSEGAFDNKELSDLSPVQIYAMNKLGLYQNVITDKDEYSFAIGHDIDYDDIESRVIVSEKMTFNGSNYYDTGIQLFDEDRDFVLAIDYKFTADTMSSVLAQCYQGSGTVGFKLMYNNGVQLRWGSNAADITNINSREMIVLRHKKGDSNLYIYNSNLTGNDVEIVSLSSKEFDITSTLVFGCEKQTSTIFANYASGDIYWSKLWYADLGEDVCKQLATWTHDTLNFEACGFNRYFLSDNPDDMCSFSLLATNLLDRTQSWNSSSNTTEGWAGAYLNKYLNSRLYNAMPMQIKSLLKKVQIKSGIGGQSTDTTSSDCYIAIPSVREVNPYNTSAPYFDEGTPITIVSDVESRKRTNSDGTINEYWLRSPSNGYTSYAWYVDKDGELHSIKSVTDKIGVLILISF